MSLRNSHHEEHLAEVLSTYVDRLGHGAAPPVEEFLKRYPELADELRPLLRTCADMIDAAADAHPLFDADASFARDHPKRWISSWTEAENHYHDPRSLEEKCGIKNGRDP